MNRNQKYEEDMMESSNISLVVVPGSLSKGKKMPIGTVSRGRKKVAEGKWVDVPNKGRSAGSSGKVDMDSFMVLDDPSSKNSKEDIRREVKAHGADAVVNHLSKYAQSNSSFKDGGWDKSSIKKLVSSATSGGTSSGKVDMESFMVLDDPSSKNSKDDIRREVKAHGAEAVVNHLSKFAQSNATFREEGWSKESIKKLVSNALQKSSHGHPAGTSQANTKTKSKIPYTGHEERMRFAKMAAARMLGAGSPESSRAYADNPTVDHKGREAGQKAPHSNYGTGVSGMGSQAHSLYGVPSFIVSPSELGSSIPEGVTAHTPVRNISAPKK